VSLELYRAAYLRRHEGSARSRGVQIRGIMTLPTCVAVASNSFISGITNPTIHAFPRF